MATLQRARRHGFSGVFLLGASLLAGCSTLSGARPLDRGQHEVGAVFGGPLIAPLGFAMPFPNLVVAGRSGLPALADRPFDLGYGLNATGLAFGIAALHADLGWQLAPQSGAWPAFTVRNKVFLLTNIIAANKADDASRGLSVADEIDAIASWSINPAQSSLFYVSVAQTFDFGAPGLLLTPGIGTEIDPGGRGGLKFLAEVRWWGINRESLSDNAAFVPGRPGAIGIQLGLSYGFGGAR